MLKQLLKEWLEAQELRRQKLHAQFHYCNPDHPGCVTFDNQKFFQTLSDARKYQVHLDKAMRLVVRLMSHSLRKYSHQRFAQWKELFAVEIEERRRGLASDQYGLRHHESHINESLVHGPDGEVELTHSQQQYQAYANYLQFMARQLKYREYLFTLDASQLSADSCLEDYQILELDLATNRRNQQCYQLSESDIMSTDDPDPESVVANQSCPPIPFDVHNRNVPLQEESWITTASSQAVNDQTQLGRQSLPPAYPFLGITLPSLRPAHLSSLFQSRLFPSPAIRSQEAKFNAYMKGPTETSCWVIPGVLAMGSIPNQAAHRRTTLPATTALCFAGLNSFVSLMLEDEETEVLSSSSSPDIASQITQSTKQAQQQLADRIALLVE